MDIIARVSWFALYYVKQILMKYMFYKNVVIYNNLISSVTYRLSISPPLDNLLTYFVLQINMIYEHKFS